MLELAGLDAYYGQAHVLHDVSLTLAEGERIAVLGRNGAGKSTLLKSIMNADPVVTGRVVYEGRELGRTSASDRVRLGMALVPEDRRIFTHLTVTENLRLARHGTAPGTVLPTIDEVIARFPMLDGLRGRLGGQMSGGQQQVLAVARAVAARPRLMLLDEPTEGLAPVIVEALAREVVDCCEAYGMALILAEQSVWFARRCTSRVLILDSGAIVFRGTWDAFDAERTLVERYLAL